MTTNTKVTILFLVALVTYIAKVPIGIILYLNGDYYGLLLTLILATSVEVFSFTTINSIR